MTRDYNRKTNQYTYKLVVLSGSTLGISERPWSRQSTETCLKFVVVQLHDTGQVLDPRAATITNVINKRSFNANVAMSVFYLFEKWVV